MNTIIKKLTGMDALTEQVVAMDLLNSAKSGIRNYAMAITESGTPEIKATLIRHLEESLDMHEIILNYVMEKGWYQAWDRDKQTELNLQNIETVINLPTL
ncbi:spore coat protein [Rummeliibacillus sp. G93]|uniref:spore coat protein n=1 Tax=Rummeliibacillus sp. G93 TaxID=2939494 RepID=UPI00201CA816|nr:spore coat protein [Rummeliibacillus sp. G93]UQW96221.1 spore coat protein [Rummeliibacillus sp. G93]